ncbi:MAG: thioredoxin family protein [Deltaproteobacteria bacterium]|nr:thioredoxin family protein [Deltaproteobacteria bacterium]
MASFEESLARGTLWAFATAFGSGVATSFTGCVYPMIPITVSIFGAKSARSRGQAFLLATCYVMGIAVMYATLGVLAALAGWAAGNLLASPWVIVPLCGLFVALAASMLGLWEIRLPAALQNRMALIGGHGYRGAFAMGLVGGILIAPCAGAWLGGLLGYVAATRNVFLGGGLLFTYALGIGLLFWVIATSAVSLPKSGGWMDSVKSALGVALLVATLYYLQNVLAPLARYTSGSWRFAGLNLALAVAGIAVGGLHLTYHGAGALTALRKTVGVLALSVGLFGVVNFAFTSDTKLPWLYEESVALERAKRHQKPLLIDVWARWCIPCKEMESKVLADAAVRRELGRFVMFKADVTEDTAAVRALRQRYRAAEIPLLIALDSEGRERMRVGKIDSADELLTLLRRVP